jgi:hypothetical protein
MSTWNNKQSLEALGFQDAGEGGWVRTEAPHPVIKSKPAFDVESGVRPDANGLWNRVTVTVTHSDSQGANLWWAFDLQGQQTDTGGYPDKDTHVAEYMDDEEDAETRQTGEAHTFSELSEYAAQVARSVVHT